MPLIIRLHIEDERLFPNAKRVEMRVRNQDVEKTLNEVVHYEFLPEEVVKAKMIRMRKRIIKRSRMNSSNRNRNKSPLGENNSRTYFFNNFFCIKIFSTQIFGEYFTTEIYSL